MGRAPGVVPAHGLAGAGGGRAARRRRPAAPAPPVHHRAHRGRARRAAVGAPAAARRRTACAVVLTAAAAGQRCSCCARRRPRPAAWPSRLRAGRAAGRPGTREDWARGAAGATVVGTRAAAWAPVGDLAAIVVLDEHDEAHQQEQAPTWHARDVALERARRAGVPCLLMSPCPTLEALGGGRAPRARPRRRAGRAGPWSRWSTAATRTRGRPACSRRALVRLLRSGRAGPVRAQPHRPGPAAGLRGVRRAGPLRGVRRVGRAARRAAALPALRHRAAGGVPHAAGACASATCRPGVAGSGRSSRRWWASRSPRSPRPPSEGAAGTRVVVGTEAVLQRVDRADAVAFLDLDQELLAPRYRAAEQAFALVARAARSPPARAGRSAGGRPRAAADPAARPRGGAGRGAGRPAPRGRRRARRRASSLGFPPFAAMAEVSGAAAPAFIEALGQPLGVQVAEVADGRWLAPGRRPPRRCATPWPRSSGPPAACASRSTRSAAG